MGESGNPADVASTAAAVAVPAAGAAPGHTGTAPTQGAVAGHRTAIVADFLERAGWSAGEQFFAVLLTTSTVTVAGLPWASATVTAVGAAVISLLTTLVEYLVPPLRRANYWTELALRLGKTFISSLFGAMAAQAAFGFLHLSWTTALNLAAVATLGALGKGLLARNSVGAPNASTLSAATYDSARKA